MTRVFFITSHYFSKFSALIGRNLSPLVRIHIRVGKKIYSSNSNQAIKCVFGSILKKPAYFTIQLTFATIHGPTALFSTIHESHCII